jgi:outer membrane scaffolding protein for murein synthesis (MipA/OmpV family)
MVVYQYRRVWSVDLNQPWVLVGSAETRHLHGDGTHSPLTERATNSYISAGIAYRF